MNARSSSTYEDSNANINVMEGALEIRFSALIYAVSYPTFKSTGQKIVHDPTFSIFITFDNPMFWAVILVFGSVILVGVATVMIMKKKNGPVQNYLI